MRLIRPLGLAALALLGACADRAPLDPDPAGALPPDAQRFDCIARVRESTVTCGAHAASPVRGAIIGGQGQYVRLTSSNVAFDAGTGTFSFDETVQNLLPYAMGTLDGVTPDPEGIRVFLHSGPTVTSGWGTATVQNADGVGVFTATSQPYFQYPGILAPNQTSAAKTWLFHLDPDVDVFAFTLYVSTHTSPTVVISEIMAHPTTASEPAGEWFEVHNRSSDTVNLQGWIIASAGDAPHTIASSLKIAPHEYVVLGGSTSTAANGGAPVQYAYTGIDLANGTADWLVLRAPSGLTADSVDWGAAPAETAAPPPTGISLELDSLDSDNTWLSGASSHWVPAVAAFGAGQLGTPGGRRLVPLQAISVATTRFRTCVVDTAGQGWCWGTDDFSSRLGAGDTMGTFPNPRKVLQPAGVSFTQVAAKPSLTCALSTTGVPYCWGSQVPLPSGPALRTTPWPLAVPSGIVFASLDVGRDESGNYSVCAVDTAGQPWCWGTTHLTAVPLATPEPVVQLAIEDVEMCVRSAAGNVYCKTTGFAADTFVAVRQPRVTFQWVDTNEGEGCAVSDIGQIQCWQSRGYTPVPNDSLPPSVRFSSLALGRVLDVCAVATTGQLYCGGENGSGQLGDGTRAGHSLAPVTQPAGVLFSSVSLSGLSTAVGQQTPEHTCALRQGSGDVYCWGSNAYGQLGDGTLTDRLVPVPVYR